MGRELRSAPSPRGRTQTTADPNDNTLASDWYTARIGYGGSDLGTSSLDWRNMIHPNASDTFTVRSGRRLVIPVLGEIALHGVLRSELEPHLAGELARYVRDPDVDAHSLIRLGVLGAVANPGFYTIPADALVTDAIMRAGGPANSAELASLRIERHEEEIWAGEPLQRAVDDGRTLDQMNLRAGDRIVLPEQTNVSVTNVLRIARWVTALVPSVILLATQVF